MKDILKDHNQIIINTDIDGILCGLVLKNYLDCEIVGYSNSAETVWIDESKIKSIYDAVYIDMFVPRDDIITIDQHIIAVNDTHYQILKRNPNKINPNLDLPRYFLPNASYYLKYPFGTIHYICAALEKEGVTVQFDMNDSCDNVRLGDLILRADDAMTTTLKSNYIMNARSWWKWLLDFSNHGQAIQQFVSFLNGTSPQSAYPIKDKIAGLLQGPRFCCDSPDGGFKSIVDTQGSLLPQVRSYIEYIATRTSLKPFDLKGKYTPHEGIAKRMFMKNPYIDELIHHQTINGEQVFSYGFVRSSNKLDNFSYTVM